MSDPAYSLDSLPAPREVAAAEPAAFRRHVESRYEPLVIRGLGADWPLVAAAGQSDRAAVDYLAGFDSGAQLPLIVADTDSRGRLFYNESYDGFNFSRESATLQHGLERLLARDAAGDELFFQCVRLAESMPALAAALPNPLIPPGAKPNIWIGSRVTVAPHFDEAKNVAVVAAGRRRFTLFPPEQVDNLYVGRLDFTPSGQPISLVDVDKPDFGRFPRFRDALASAVSVELGPGDALYIPAPWWHHVKSLERFNVLVNYWWDGAWAASALPFTALVHAIQAFRHLPDGERRAWRSLLDHYAFEINGDAVGHLNDHGAGILEPMTPALARHIHAWLAAQMTPRRK